MGWGLNLENANSGHHQHGKKHIEFLLDVRKAFEHVNRSQLLEEAIVNKFPMAEALASISSYCWPRYITCEGLIAEPIVPKRGIAAGSAFATFELWCLLRSAIMNLQIAHPNSTLCLHVDDLCLTATGETNEEVLIEAESMASMAVHEFTKLKGLPFAEEKTYVISSDAALARAAARNILPSATAVETVRRLGVDYTLSAVANKKCDALPVYKQRIKGVAAKVRRLQRIAPKGAPRLFSAGIIPSALYGAEHFTIPPKDVAMLQRQAVKCSNIRPFGVPTTLGLLGLTTENDPSYRARSAPILRWAREIWLATDPARRRPRDTLKYHELHEAHARFIGAHSLPQGPARAIKDSLSWFGWTMPKPHILLTSTGEELDMEMGSPAMLKHYLIRAHEEKADKACEEVINQRGTPLSCGEKLDWFLIRKILRKKKIPAKVKTTILEIVYGTAPTPSWLWAHGWQISPTCDQCGCQKDIDHLASGCAPRDNIRKLICKALTTIKVPEKCNVFSEIKYFVNGCLMDKKKFRFQPDEPIFTDGSAKNIQWPELAVAASACFQTDKHGIKRWIVAQVPPEFPISAVSSEFFAFALAADVLPLEGQVPPIVSDCQAVVQAFANLARHSDYRSKFAGMWKTPNIARIPACLKVKAHLCQHEAKELGLEAFWYGNDRADHFAKESLADTWKDGIAYVANRKENIAKVVHLAEQVSEKMQPIKGIPKEARPKSQKISVAVPHQFIWTKDRWLCLGCGGIKRSDKSRLDKVSCHTRKLNTAGCHPSHRLFGAWEVAAFAHQGAGGEAAPITFCMQCGCYSSTRLVDLKHRCIKGTARSKLTIIKRLKEQKHPSSKVPLVGVHRILIDNKVIIEEVQRSSNPGTCKGGPSSQSELEPSEEPSCPVDQWQDAFPVMDEDSALEVLPHEAEELEAARALGLYD
jgi:hypothetical protein